jgi:hypothetical protein
VRFALENPLARLAVVALSSATNTVLYIGLHLLLEKPVSNVLTYTDLGRVVAWRTIGDTCGAIVGFIILDRVFSEQAAARRMAIKKRFYE